MGSWRGQRALQELPAWPSWLLWVTAHGWVRWQKGRKECPLEQWLGPSLCEWQSLLCSRWDMLEYILICQQCMWAAAHMMASDSPCLTKSQGMQRSDFMYCVLYQWYSYMNTSKFWLKLGFYPLARNPWALVAWVRICRNWSVQMAVSKPDHWVKWMETSQSWPPTSDTEEISGVIIINKRYLTSSEGLSLIPQGRSKSNCNYTISVIVIRLMIANYQWSWSSQCTNSNSLFTSSLSVTSSELMYIFTLAEEKVCLTAFCATWERCRRFPFFSCCKGLSFSVDQVFVSWVGIPEGINPDCIWVVQATS